MDVFHGFLLPEVEENAIWITLQGDGWGQISLPLANAAPWTAPILPLG